MATRKQLKASARTRREDWLDRGLDVLARKGPAALTISTMCAELSRTKGAFYHHFDSADAFHDALLEHWQARLTAAPIAVADAGSDAKERRERLQQAVSRLDNRLDLAVRAWAGKHSTAAQRLAEVDKQRVAYIEQLHVAGNGAPRKDARLLAQIEYAAFVGAQQLFGDLSTHAARGLQAGLARALDLLALDLKKHARKR